MEEEKVITELKFKKGGIDSGINPNLEDWEILEKITWGILSDKYRLGEKKPGS